MATKGDGAGGMAPEDVRAADAKELSSSESRKKRRHHKKNK